MNQVTDKRKVNFTLVENELIDNKNLDVYAKMTYIVLCRFARDGQCFPSYQTLADRVGCSKRKMIDTMKLLIEKGLIQKEIRKNEYDENTSNMYYIIGFKNYSQGSEHDALQGSEQHALPIEHDAPKQDIINNTNNINQSVSQSIDNGEETDGLTDDKQSQEEVKQILTQSNVELYNAKEFIKSVIIKLYTDSNMPQVLKMGLTHTEIKTRLQQLTNRHIDTALLKLKDCKSNKELYFAKVLLTQILELSIDDYIQDLQE